MNDFKVFELFNTNPVPLIPNIKKKRPYPGFTWKHLQNKSYDAMEAEGVIAKYPQANWGLPVPPHILCLDFDAPGVYERFVEMGMPTTGPIVATSRGKHCYFQRPAAFKHKRNKPATYDVLVTGALVTVPPSIHFSGCSYTWINRPENELPALPEEIVSLIIEETTRKYKNSKPQPISKQSVVASDHPPMLARPKNPVAYAIQTLHDESQRLGALEEGGRNSTLNTCSLKLSRIVATGETTLNKDSVYSAMWDACEKNGLLNEDGTDAFNSTFHSGWNEGSGQPFWTPGSVLKEKGKMFLSYEEMLSKPERSWFIPKLIGEGDTAFLFGASNAGKSFIAIDMGLCAATGREWCGQQIKPVTVLYVPSEGHGGLDSRIKAWDYTNDPLAEVNFHVFNSTLNLSNAESVKQFVEGARAYNSGFIIFDTYIGLAGLTNENCSAESQKVINTLSEIKRELNCTILVIHHPGKNQDNGMRGSYNTLAGAETVLELRNTNNSLFLTAYKLRDSSWLYFKAVGALQTTVDEKGQELGAVVHWRNKPLYGDKSLVAPPRKSPEESERERILDALKSGPLKTRDLSAKAYVEMGTINKRLNVLEGQGMVMTPKRGLWQLTPDRPLALSSNETESSSLN